MNRLKAVLSRRTKFLRIESPVLGGLGRSDARQSPPFGVLQSSQFSITALNDSCTRFRGAYKSASLSYSRTLAKVAFAVVIGAATSRTGQFPGTGPHKVAQITLRIWWDRKYSENYTVATLRVFALDTKLPVCGLFSGHFRGHFSNLGGVRAREG
jgi:hypothetical protein